MNLSSYLGSGQLALRLTWLPGPYVGSRALLARCAVT